MSFPCLKNQSFNHLFLFFNCSCIPLITLLKCSNVANICNVLHHMVDGITIIALLWKSIYNVVFLDNGLLQYSVHMQGLPYPL